LNVGAQAEKELKPLSSLYMAETLVFISLVSETGLGTQINHWFIFCAGSQTRRPSPHHECPLHDSNMLLLPLVVVVNEGQAGL